MLCKFHKIRRSKCNMNCVCSFLHCFPWKEVGNAFHVTETLQSQICIMMSVNPRRRCVHCSMQANGSWQKEGAVSSISSDFLNTLRFLVLSFLKIRFLRKDLQSERDYFPLLWETSRGEKIPKIKAALTFCFVITRRSGCHSKYPLDMISTASLRKWECPLLDLSLVFSVTPAMWTLWV